MNNREYRKLQKRDAEIARTIFLLSSLQAYGSELQCPRCRADVKHLKWTCCPEQGEGALSWNEGINWQLRELEKFIEILKRDIDKLSQG